MLNILQNIKYYQGKRLTGLRSISRQIAGRSIIVSPLGLAIKTIKTEPLTVVKGSEYLAAHLFASLPVRGADLHLSFENLTPIQVRQKIRAVVRAEEVDQLTQLEATEKIKIVDDKDNSALTSPTRLVMLAQNSCETSILVQLLAGTVTLGLALGAGLAFGLSIPAALGLCLPALIGCAATHIASVYYHFGTLKERFEILMVQCLFLHTQIAESTLSLLPKIETWLDKPDHFRSEIKMIKSGNARVATLLRHGQLLPDGFDRDLGLILPILKVLKRSFFLNILVFPFLRGSIWATLQAKEKFYQCYEALQQYCLPLSRAAEEAITQLKQESDRRITHFIIDDGNHNQLAEIIIEEMNHYRQLAGLLSPRLHSLGLTAEKLRK